ncbi:MAG: Cytochrome c-type biogenesis protein CcmC, putative heme lyase for CcmE, partial [uncultured Solirubrobacteraceae bacterium]
VRPGLEAPLHRLSRRHHRRVRARVLLRAQRRGPGLHPEDLLRPRADGDRRPRRLRGGRHLRDQAPALGPSGARHEVLRRDPRLDHARARDARHRDDLGEGLVGEVVAVGRADARRVPHRLPALRLLPAAALLDRGPRAPGALRRGLRDRRGRLRADLLHVRPLRPGGRHPPARARPDRRRDARLDVPHLPALHGGDDAAVHDAVEVRADLQGRAHADRRAAPPARGGL